MLRFIILMSCFMLMVKAFPDPASSENEFSDEEESPDTPPSEDEDTEEESEESDEDSFENQPDILEVPPWDHGDRKKRNIQANEAYRWNKTIPYRLGNGITGAIKENIEQAVKKWQKNTCLKFKEGNGKPALLFNMQARGCNSYLGNQHFCSYQVINLDKSCAKKIGHICHEIGHAIGMNHEHSRADRADANVTINAAAVIKWYMPAFAKENEDKWSNLCVPYDYGSGMHYGAKAFSKNKKAKTINSDTRLSQLLGPSFGDETLINHAYKCIPKCEKLVCENGGYPHPNPKNPKDECKVCHCPEGLGGKTCNKGAESAKKCYPNERTITVNSRNQVKFLNSPNYGKKYGRGAKCGWMLKGANNARIEYYFDGRFQVAYRKQDDTCYHWVEILDGPNLGRQRGDRYCGKGKPVSGKMISKTDTMVVSFNAEYKDTKMSGKGFRLWYRLADDEAYPNKCVGDTTCGPNGKCYMDGSAKRCECDSGYTGPTCQEKKCDCVNGECCLGNSSCRCKPGFFGRYCQFTDPCNKEEIEKCKNQNKFCSRWDPQKNGTYVSHCYSCIYQN